jgi:hypothetical protein
MSECIYVFKIGKKKGQTCGRSCKNTYCGRHNPITMEKKRDRMAELRESPEYREKECQYIATKRQDPAYKQKEKEYIKEYCNKQDLHDLNSMH